MILIVEIALAVLAPVPALLAAWTVHELSHWATLRVLRVPVRQLRLGPFEYEAVAGVWTAGGSSGSRSEPAVRDSVEPARVSRRRALGGGKGRPPHPPHAS